MDVVDGATMASDEFDEEDALGSNATLGVRPNVKSCQVSKEETDYYHEKFSDVSGVRFYRIHCTSCDKHLGSAPATQRNRFEHPLLKVLMCLQCYDFYTSGEFETDEDGSELYCRWCGQGGQVYCCAICPFVFCKKCIKRNLGTTMVKSIEQSDDWLCYGCRPDDIWMHRAINWALKRYSSQLCSIDPEKRTPQQIALLSQDCTTCCKKDKQKKTEVDTLETFARNATGLKRPLPEPDDRSAKKLRVCQQTILPKPYGTVRVAKPAPKSGPEIVAPPPVVPPPPPEPPIVAEENSDEVVCTPDILPIGEEEDVDDPAPRNPTNAEEPRPTASSNSDDDCKIIEDPPPKKPYVQVKPASKLLESAATPKNSMPPPLIYPTAVLKVSPKDPPPLVKTAAAQDAPRPIRPRPTRHVPMKLPETVQKMIKIVSPDGRSFYIDPAKLVPPGVTTAPIVLQTLPPAPASADTSTDRLDWFDRAISEWQFVIQALTTNIVELMHLYNGGTANPEYLYTNFLVRIQSSIDKIEDLKRRLTSNYFKHAPSSRAPGAEASGNKNDEPPGAVPSAIVHDSADDVPPPLTFIVNGSTPSNATSLPFSRPISMVSAESAVPAADAAIPTILDDLRRLVDVARSESPAMTITGDLATDSDVTAKPDAPSNERLTIDANSKETRCVENIDEEWNERCRVDGGVNTDDSPSESGKRPAEDTHGSRSADDRPGRKTRRSTYVGQPCDQTDHIYDMQVTCDSDESDDDAAAAAKRDDSDYVAEEDEEDDTDSVVSNKSSAKSVVIIDDDDDDDYDGGEPEVQEVDDETAENKTDVWNDDDVTVIEDESRDALVGDDVRIEDVRSPVGGDVASAPDEFDGRESVEAGRADDGPEKKYDPDAHERNDRGSVAEDGDSENDDESVGNAVRSNVSTSSSDERNERGPRSVTPAVSTRTPAGVRTDETARKHELAWTNRAVVDSEEDLAAIAEAIRESIRDVAVASSKPKKERTPSASDLEELLTSNVVFKKPDCGSPRPHDGAKRPAPADNSKSFGDAFSNFVATARSPPRAQQAAPARPDAVGEIDLENEMEQLQRLAEKCIAKSNERDESETSVDC